jgi:hypothetical protein
VPVAAILSVVGLLAACNSNDNTVLLTPLPAPDSLQSVSLNQAIDLFWSDNAAVSGGSRFYWYQVYSTSYDLDHGLCGTTWYIEGATATPEFLVGALTNGVPECYAVSAVSTDGTESVWSDTWEDTPRPDARNVWVYAFAQKADSSGFLFCGTLVSGGACDESDLGVIGNPGTLSVDFKIDRNAADSTLWIVPVFSGTTVQSVGYVYDLTSIDFAPVGGYAADSVQAQVGYGYVFQIVDGTALHYGALRMTHVGRQYLVFDWSVQTDPGNPELELRGGLQTAKPSGSIVVAAH